jgi:hypothetical protein
MKRFLMAVALACALSGSALAGIVPTTDAVAPAPDGIVPTTDSTSPGEIPSSDLAVLLAILDLAF